MNIIKRKDIISVILGICSLLYYPFLVIFGEVLRFQIIGIYYLEITGVIFGILALIGIFSGIRSRNSKQKIFALLGIILSSIGLVIIVGFISFIYLVGYFWGG